MEHGAWSKKHTGPSGWGSSLICSPAWPRPKSAHGLMRVRTEHWSPCTIQTSVEAPVAHRRRSPYQSSSPSCTLWGAECTQRSHQHRGHEGTHHTIAAIAPICICYHTIAAIAPICTLSHPPYPPHHHTCYTHDPHHTTTSITPIIRIAPPHLLHILHP